MVLSFKLQWVQKVQLYTYIKIISQVLEGKQTWI